MRKKKELSPRVRRLAVLRSGRPLPPGPCCCVFPHRSARWLGSPPRFPHHAARLLASARYEVQAPPELPQMRERKAKYRVREMFASGEDLPLFSGTAPRPAAKALAPFVPEASARQASMHKCSICFDTGAIYGKPCLYCDAKIQRVAPLRKTKEDPSMINQAIKHDKLLKS